MWSNIHTNILSYDQHITITSPICPRTNTINPSLCGEAFIVVSFHTFGHWYGVRFCTAILPGKSIRGIGIRRLNTSYSFTIKCDADFTVHRLWTKEFQCLMTKRQHPLARLVLIVLMVSIYLYVQLNRNKTNTVHVIHAETHTECPGQQIRL